MREEGIMDKMQWFKFSYADWRMGKIQRCPEITQARFINLICLYWSKDCILSYEDAEIEIDKEHLDILISKKVVSHIDNSINIGFLDEQIEEINEHTKLSSTKGKIGNLKRWHPEIFKKYNDKQITLNQAIELSKKDNNPIDTQSPPDSPPIDTQSPNIADKRRGDKTRKEKTKEERIEDFKKSLYKYSDVYKKPDKAKLTYPNEMVVKFFEFWIESGDSDKKLKFEKEKTWQTSLRLKRWSNNNFGNKSTNHTSNYEPPKIKVYQ